PAYFWVNKKLEELKQRFPTHPPINWVESLFEAGTFGEEYPEIYKKRYSSLGYQNIGDDVEFFNAMKAMAKEAEEVFGFSFVNLGSHSLYLHANDAEQTWQIAQSLFDSEASRRLLGVGILGIDEWYRSQVTPEMWQRFPGRIVGPNVRIAKNVTLGPRAIVVGDTVLERGSEVFGYVRDSIGKLHVPENAAVFSSLLPGKELYVPAGHFALQYLIKVNGVIKAVIGNVASGTRIWQKMGDGRTWADSHVLAGGLSLRELLKVVESDLTNKIFATTLSPEILQSSASIDSLSRGVANALKAANVEMQRSELRTADESLVNAEVEAAQAAAIQAAMAKASEPKVVKTLATPKAPVPLIAAAESLQAGQLERQVPLNEAASRAEVRMMAKIAKMMQELGLESYKDQTRLVVSYERLGLDGLMQLRRENPKALIVVVAKDENRTDVEARITGFDGFELASSANLATIASEQLKAFDLKLQPGEVSKSVVQVMMRGDAQISADEIRAYGEVAKLSGILAFLGFNRPVGFASTLTVAEVLSAEIRAAEAIGKSA
ncbi:MAG: hypothetical protein V1882_06070, partial [Candidatus Omnitrophota bacterium]